jgi:hypothetical protein
MSTINSRKNQKKRGTRDKKQKRGVFITNKKHPLNNKKKQKHIKTKKNQQKLLPIVYGKIYMTNCIHCQNLKPEWDIVTDKMKIHLDVVCYDIEQSEEIGKIPKFNDTYKPYENLQIQGGYPTLYKLHKRGGAIIYYNGPRDHQSILYWLQGKVN